MTTAEGRTANVQDEPAPRRQVAPMSDELAREHVETLLAAAQELTEACTIIAKQLRARRWAEISAAGPPATVLRAAELLDDTAGSTGDTLRLLRATLDALAGRTTAPEAASAPEAAATSVRADLDGAPDQYGTAGNDPDREVVSGYDEPEFEEPGYGPNGYDADRPEIADTTGDGYTEYVGGGHRYRDAADEEPRYRIADDRDTGDQELDDQELVEGAYGARHYDTRHHDTRHHGDADDRDNDTARYRDAPNQPDQPDQYAADDDFGDEDFSASPEPTTPSSNGSLSGHHGWGGDATPPPVRLPYPPPPTFGTPIEPATGDDSGSAPGAANDGDANDDPHGSWDVTPRPAVTVVPDAAPRRRRAEPAETTNWNPPYGGSMPSSGGSSAAYANRGRHSMDETGSWPVAAVPPAGGRHAATDTASPQSASPRTSGSRTYGATQGTPEPVTAIIEPRMGHPASGSYGGDHPTTGGYSTGGYSTGAGTGSYDASPDHATPAAFVPAGRSTTPTTPPEPAQLGVTVRQVEASRRHLQGALLALRESLGAHGDVSLLALVERSLSTVTAAADQLRDTLEPAHAERVLPGEARFCCAMPWFGSTMVPTAVALAPASVPSTTRILAALGYDARVSSTVDGQPQINVTGARFRARILLQQLRMSGSGEWQAYLDFSDATRQTRSESETLGPAELTDDEVARRVDDAVRRRLC